MGRGVRLIFLRVSFGVRIASTTFGMMLDPLVHAYPVVTHYYHP
jgi:hypothetical protein